MPRPLPTGRVATGAPVESGSSPSRSIISTATVSGAIGAHGAAVDGLHERDREGGDTEQRGRDEVGESHVDDEEEAAEDRPDDRRRLPRDRLARHQPRQPLPGDGVGREGAASGKRERARGAVPDHEEEDRERRRRVTARVHRERDHEQRLDHDAGRRDPPAIEPVGDRPAHEDEERGGGELREPEQAEVELAAGEVEDLFAEDDGERGHRGGRADDGREQRHHRSALARVHARP